MNKLFCLINTKIREMNLHLNNKNIRNKTKQLIESLQLQIISIAFLSCLFLLVELLYQIYSTSVNGGGFI